MDTVANAVAQGHHHGMAVADAKHRHVKRPKKMVKGSAATKRYMAYLRSLKKSVKKKSVKRKKSAKKAPPKTPKRKRQPCKGGKVRRKAPSGKVMCLKRKRSTKKKATKKKSSKK